MPMLELGQVLPRIMLAVVYPMYAHARTWSSLNMLSGMSEAYSRTRAWFTSMLGLGPGLLCFI